MKKVDDGTCETQSQLQNRFEQIKNQCEEAAKIIRQGLLEGSAIQMSIKIITKIQNEIFSLVQDVPLLQTLKKISQQIENQLIELFKTHLKDFIIIIQTKLDESLNDKENILQIICKTYQNYKAYSYWLYKIFFYLDRFSMPILEQKSLSGTSLQLLKEGYFDKNKGMILSTIQQFILETRNNRILFDKRIKQLVELFSIMGAQDADLKYFRDKGQYFYLPKNNYEAEYYYKNQFLHPLIVETEKFYKVESETRQTLTTPEYVNWINSIFQLELDMCRECYAASEREIKNKLITLLIKEHASQLVNQKTVVDLMLQDDRKDELKSLFQFAQNANVAKDFANYYQQYFEQQGILINSINFEFQIRKQVGRQINPAELYFQKILEIMQKAQIIKEELNDDGFIQKSYNKAFILVVNKNENSPIWLAIFIDIIIRSEKGTNQIELDIKLGKVVQLFELLYQRDVFFKHYQKFLSMRLLNQQSQNLQLEKKILQKFKGETRTFFLIQLSSMINDIEKSPNFGQCENFSKDFNFEFQVNLLSQGVWPLNIIIDNLNCPPQIETALQIYQNAYLKEYRGRIVKWCYNLGQGEVVYKISNEKYYFSVNTIQIIALICFNQGDQFTIKELLELTNIERTELENCLIPFVYLKVLTRQKQDIDEFNDADEIIKTNVAFNNKAKKMRMLPNPKMQPVRQQIKQKNVEEQQQLEQINKERELVIDSLLVRLMKTRRTIKHHELVENCQQMITLFKPDVVFIKKRLENLIEREYVRRDENDWKIYHYMY